MQTLTKSQINKLPAQYTFVNGKMVRKDVVAQQTAKIAQSWLDMEVEVELAPVQDDEIFATAKR